MVKKTQPHSQPSGNDKSPEEIAQAFMQLWQEKWNDTLRQKGWPDGAPTPGLGQMPFFNPFMPMNGFTGPAGDDNAIKRLEARVTELEKRLKAAEKPKAVKKPPKAK